MTKPKVPQSLNDLTGDFWRMILVDHVARRIPRTRSPDMAVCKQVVTEYLAANSTSLSNAIKSVDAFDLDGVVTALDPPLVEWVRCNGIPDLLDKPCGLYV